MGIKNKPLLKTVFAKGTLITVLGGVLFGTFLTLLPAKEAQAATGSNELVKMANECQDFQKTEDTDFDFRGIPGNETSATGKWKSCQDLQSILNGSLGCSNNMFYAMTDPEDTSAKLNRWFIDGTKYAQCYTEAKKQIDLIAGSKCNSMRHSSENDNLDSQAWKDCTALEDSLSNALGCSDRMFRKASASETSREDIWTQNAANVANCKNRVESAGAKIIIGPNGTGGKTAAQYADEKGIKGVPNDPTSNADDNQPNCETTGSPLSWVICPIINGLAGFADTIFSQVVEPFLSNVPIGTDPSDSGFKAWQGFRLLGNTVLIGALLIMVFAQAIGRANIIEAYAIRKMAPRILLGVIAINTSLYIGVAASDITNVVGKGIGELLTTPFTGSDVFDFELGNLSVIEKALAGGLAAYGGYKAGSFLKDAFVGLFVSQRPDDGISDSLHFLLFAVVIPIALIALAVLITLVIRQGLLTLLIILAPIAFACYILPGTERYFRTWGSLFIKTLMVYPIIAIIFAMADILGSIIFRDPNPNLITIITGIIVMFLPLVLIPFSFRFAGGAMATIFSAASGVGDKMGKSGFLKSRRDFYKQRSSDAVLRGKANTYRRLSGRASTGGRFNPRRMNAARARARLAGYTGNIEAQESELNARTQEAFQKQIATGDDTLIRAYGIDRNSAERREENGVAQYRSLAGRWINDNDINRAESAFGQRNVSALQQTTAYEMTKATTQEEQDHLFNSFGNTANAMNLSQEEATGAWIGAAFARQNENRQWKHYQWSDSDAAGNPTPLRATMKGINLMREIDEKQGSYQGTMQNADTWSTMSQEVIRAKDVLDTGTTHSGAVAQASDVATARETLERSARIAHSLRAGGYPQAGETGEGDQQQPIPGQRPIREVGVGAPGRVMEEMDSFVKTVDQQADSYKTPTNDPTFNPANAPLPVEQVDPRYIQAPLTGEERNLGDRRGRQDRGRDH